MKNFAVTVKGYNEFWIYSSYDTRREAEEIRHILEKGMPGSKIEVKPTGKEEANGRTKP